MRVIIDSDALLLLEASGPTTNAELHTTQYFFVDEDVLLYNTMMLYTKPPVFFSVLTKP